MINTNIIPRWAYPHLRQGQEITDTFRQLLVLHLELGNRSLENRTPIRRTFSQEEALAIFAHDGFCCVYCFANEGPFMVDHVIPWSKGGRSERANLVTACERCNLIKSNHDGWTPVRLEELV